MDVMSDPTQQNWTPLWPDPNQSRNETSSNAWMDQTHACPSPVVMRLAPALPV